MSYTHTHRRDNLYTTYTNLIKFTTHIYTTKNSLICPKYSLTSPQIQTRFLYAHLSLYNMYMLSNLHTHTHAPTRIYIINVSTHTKLSPNTNWYDQLTESKNERSQIWVYKCVSVIQKFLVWMGLISKPGQDNYSHAHSNSNSIPCYDVVANRMNLPENVYGDMLSRDWMWMYYYWPRDMLDYTLINNNVHHHLWPICSGVLLNVLFRRQANHT